MPEEEAVLRSGGGNDGATEEVPMNGLVLKSGRMKEVAGKLTMGESSERLTQSSAPSSSSLTALSSIVADWEDELLGSYACVPRGWVLGMKACILR